MEKQKLKQKLEMRDQQIKAMENQIADFKKNISLRDSKIIEMEQNLETLDTKIKRKHEQLGQELSEKEQLLAKLEKLEAFFESRSKNQNPKLSRTKSEDGVNVTSAYIEFYKGLQTSNQTTSNKISKENIITESGADKKRSGSVFVDNIDITAELEKLGISNVVKKYN